MLVPETLVWTSRPERLGFSLVDTLFGSADFPGELRAAGQLLFNHKNSVIRAGEPVSLREFLAQEVGRDDGTSARRLGYALLRKLERERRAVLGPAQKPVDRVREEVLKSPKLQAVLRDLAGSDAKAQALLEDKARGMLRQLMTAPDPGTLRGLEVIADTLANQVYAGIDVDREGIERVREAARRGSIVFLPSHKSHVDYLLLLLRPAQERAGCSRSSPRATTSPSSRWGRSSSAARARSSSGAALQAATGSIRRSSTPTSAG